MATKERTLSMPDWYLLPGELLHIIAEKLENCFDVVHARSVCSSWRSTIPFPGSLLRPSFSIPRFNEVTLEHHKDLCTLEKIPLFLVRVQPLDPATSSSEYFLGGIGRRDESKDHIELPPPLQCSVKIPGSSEPTLMNVLDCQILPMGHQYRMLCCDPKHYMGMAFLPLNKEGGRGFALLLNYRASLWVLTSAQMKWKQFENVTGKICTDVVTFRGKFYASLLATIVVIDPCSLETAPLMSSHHLELLHYLVPSGDDELFLVELIYLPGEIFVSSRLSYRVSRLDEEAGKWVVVTDLGDRVLFINLYLGNVCCSAKELPDGCGLSGNSIVFTDAPGGETFFYKYGVDTGNAEDDLSCWRSPRETCVRIISRSPMAVHFRVEQNLTLDT